MNRNGMFFIVLMAVALFIAINVTAEDKATKEEKKPEEAQTAPIETAAKEEKLANSTETKSEAGEAKEVEKNASAKEVKGKNVPATPIAITLEAVKELELRKKNLDDREIALNERSKALDIQEKILREKLLKLEELSRKVAEKLDGFKAKHEEKVSKLVTVVEGMKPQNAAEFMENLEPDLAVEILTRINIQKASKILNLLNKQKGARLTELYAGYRNRQSLSNNEAVSDIKSKEGGVNTGKL